jgi:plasmid stabilization system protein ParE
MKVVLSRRAIIEIQEIGDYIAQDNPERAAYFVRELRTACLTLVELPFAFPIVQRYADHEVRRRLHGNYVVLYRVEVDANRIVVLNVLHGASDYLQTDL